jgi:hypothetical protein
VTTINLPQGRQAAPQARPPRLSARPPRLKPCDAGQAERSSNPACGMLLKLALRAHSLSPQLARRSRGEGESSSLSLMGCKII